MKVDNLNNFKTNAIGEDYKIATTGKMFSILSQKLYSNPVLAIVRELSCNAIDAHKSIGSTEPFDIHLPSEEDPVFYVEDFGVGMSLKELIGSSEAKEYLKENYSEIFDDTPCHGVYTTYGESLKTSTNDLTGGFGLGSKTPFAYTNVFTIKTTKDGYTTILINFIDEQSIPKYAITSFQKTSEKSGTKVYFKVENQDLYKFNYALSSCMLYFEIKPNIFNFPENEKNKWDDLFKIEDYINSKRHDLYIPIKGNNRSMLICGSAAYPLNDSPILEELEKSKIGLKTKEILAFLLEGKYFPIPIGELSISPSREEVVYDKKTISYLLQIYHKLEAIFIEQMDTEPSFKDLFEMARNSSNYQLADDLSIVFRRPWVFADYSDLAFMKKVREYEEKKRRLYDHVYSFIQIRLGDCIPRSSPPVCKTTRIYCDCTHFETDIFCCCSTQEEFDSLRNSFPIKDADFIGKINKIKKTSTSPAYNPSIIIVSPDFVKVASETLGFDFPVIELNSVEPIKFTIDKPKRAKRQSVTYDKVIFYNHNGRYDYGLKTISKDKIDVQNTIFIVKKSRKPYDILFDSMYNGNPYTVKSPSINIANLYQLSGLIHFLKKLKMIKNQEFVLLGSPSKFYFENNNLDKILKFIREKNSLRNMVSALKYVGEVNLGRLRFITNVYNTLSKKGLTEVQQQNFTKLKLIAKYDSCNFSIFFKCFTGMEESFSSLFPIKSIMLENIVNNFSYYCFEENGLIDEITEYICSKQIA